MSCNIDLYLDFDPHTMKTDPTADIATLVEVALASEESIDAAEMHKSTEWPLRCFNPAFAFLVSRIDDGRVSRVVLTSIRQAAFS
jgi:hypothetical protein